MAEVVLDNACKRYEGGPLVVNRVSLRVRDGEFLVLVGPSGCGKSTTLRMVAGLEEITSGAVSIDGRVVNDVPPKDRDIAMVFQNYALYPHMNVFENMAFGLRLRGMPRQEIRERVSEAAAILGLDDLLRRLPRQLSGGQRQRVAVGRAIVRKPKVFLFDEPLSNLDAKMRVETRGEIKRLHRRLGTTMIYVTHDQVEAMTMGDRIVVMNEGKVQQVAAPLEVYQRPANLFVAGFIGTPAMNFLEGTLVSGEDGATVMRHAGGDFPLHGLAKARLAGKTAGRRVVLGFRPESVRQTSGHAHLQGCVDVVEPMGAETFVQVVLRGGARVVARMDASYASVPGMEIGLSLDTEVATLFDAATRSTIT